MTTAPPTVKPTYSTRAKVLIVLGLIVATGCFVAAYVTSDAGEDGARGPVESGGTILPDFVERIAPTDGSEALGQAEVGLDLIAGWSADIDLQIGGEIIDLPTDELRVVPELNAVYFQPGEGKSVERFEGRTCVIGQGWETSRGRGTATAFGWCFDALGS
jgi:hypothetical protein